MSTFRSEIFKICKKLQKKDKSHEISSLIKDLTITVEDTETGEIKRNKHGEFAYIAKHSNNQFHGYLFVDENIETINKLEPFRVEKLSKEERENIEIGHRTLAKFIKLCLEDFELQSKSIAESISPYAMFKKVTFDSSGEMLLSDEEMKPAVEAFKKGVVYQTLIKSKLTTLFKKTPFEQLIALIDATGKEIQKSYDDFESDIEQFSLIKTNGCEDIKDVTICISVLMFALKESLRMACNLFYEAICGDDLIVLNNDNIINIENTSSNRVVKRYKVLVQDIYHHIASDSMGSVLLIDCETSYGTKIHEFGMIVASTISFAGEMGCTTKYTFLAVNEELISINIITDFILKKGLPKLVENGKPY